MALKQSFSWDGFIRTGIDPGELARGAAEIGYQGVDLAPPDAWQVIRDHGLTLVSIAGHPLQPTGLNQRAAFAAIEADVRANLAHAATWGIPYVLVFSGNRVAGVDAETAAQIAAEHLSKLAPLAANAGVTLVLELLNSKAPGRDYEADHTAWGVRVCELVDSAHVKLLYDIFHMQMMEGDIIATIRKHHAHIGHYHTAGNPGRADLDESQELHYPAIVRAIAETGYTGWIGHEFFPKGEAIGALRAAFATCSV